MNVILVVAFVWLTCYILNWRWTILKTAEVCTMIARVFTGIAEDLVDKLDQCGVAKCLAGKMAQRTVKICKIKYPTVTFLFEKTGNFSMQLPGRFVGVRQQRRKQAIFLRSFG